MTVTLPGKRRDLFFRLYSSQLKTILALITGLLIPGLIWAQSELYQLSAVNLDNLNDFKSPPANWKIVGGLKAGFNDTLFSAAPGNGVLLDQFDPSIRFKPNTNIFTAFDHGDIYLELDFMMPKGSNSGIYFQSRYEVQLFDSWGVQFPKSQDVGAIYERWDDTKP